MKHLFFFLAFGLFSMQGIAQEGVYMSGMGGPTFEFSTLDGVPSTGFGGAGAAIINRKFFIGGYGGGILSQSKVYADTLNVTQSIGHGGLWFGYNFWPKEKFNIVLSGKTGWGGYSIRETEERDPYFRYTDDATIVSLAGEIGLEYKFIPFLLISVNGGYRYVPKVDVSLVDQNSASSYTISLMLKFGWFE